MSTCEGRAGEALNSPLQFPFLFNINLHKFIFLFDARGSEKRDDHYGALLGSNLDNKLCYGV